MKFPSLRHHQHVTQDAVVFFKALVFSVQRFLSVQTSLAVTQKFRNFAVVTDSQMLLGIFMYV